MIRLLLLLLLLLWCWHYTVVQFHAKLEIESIAHDLSVTVMSEHTSNVEAKRTLPNSDILHGVPLQHCSLPIVPSQIHACGGTQRAANILFFFSLLLLLLLLFKSRIGYNVLVSGMVILVPLGSKGDCVSVIFTPNQCDSHEQTRVAEAAAEALTAHDPQRRVVHDIDESGHFLTEPQHIALGLHREIVIASTVSCIRTYDLIQDFER